MAEHTTAPAYSSHTEMLVVQRRVPEEFSAPKAEHQWHLHPDMMESDVTGLSIGLALEQREAMLAAVPPRNDYEFRVVLVTKDIIGRVIT